VIIAKIRNARLQPADLARHRGQSPSIRDWFHRPRTALAPPVPAKRPSLPRKRHGRRRRAKLKDALIAFCVSAMTRDWNVILSRPQARSEREGFVMADLPAHTHADADGDLC